MVFWHYFFIWQIMDLILFRFLKMCLFLSIYAILTPFIYLLIWQIYIMSSSSRQLMRKAELKKNIPGLKSTNEFHGCGEGWTWSLQSQSNLFYINTFALWKDYKFSSSTSQRGKKSTLDAFTEITLYCTHAHIYIIAEIIQVLNSKMKHLKHIYTSHTFF